MGKNISCMTDVRVHTDVFREAVPVHGLTIGNRFAILEIGGGRAGPTAPSRRILKQTGCPFGNGAKYADH